MLCAGGALAETHSPWTSPAGVWAFTGGASYHSSLTRRPFPEISAPRWTRFYDDAGNYIRWVWEASAVVTPDLVLALGYVSAPAQPPNRPKVFAFQRDDGSQAWQADLPSISLGQFFQGSQSSLCLDVLNRDVLAVIGKKVVCLELCHGEERWVRELPRNIVNATPVVTDDLGERDRLFITDYDAANGDASLYCINVDEYCATNPFQPGDIVWTAPINGGSGNTPAYLPRRLGGQGRVYVASAGHYGLAPGTVYAFPAEGDTTPDPLWSTDNVLPHGFFGGVTVVPTGLSGGTELLVASYAFSGGIYSADMIRIDARTGAVLGAALVNRSSSMPVVIPGGQILTTGGLEGINPGDTDTVPSLCLYSTSLMDPPASPTTGSLVWNSAIDTWIDLDFDGVMDPGEYLNIGGYTHQPLVSLWKGRPSIAVGSFAPGFSPSAAPSLWVLDLQLNPVHPSFVKDTVTGAGGSPSLAGPNLYSIGSEGLCAFGPEPVRFDVDCDKKVDAGDLAKWDRGQGNRDVNGDGSVTGADRDAVVTLLRANEPADMLEGRR